MLNRNDVKRLIRIFSFVAISIVIIGYSIFATHDLILGPEIVMIEPEKDINSFATSSVTIVGIAKRSQNITLNGKSLTVDEKGNFRETTLLAKGYNVFILKAEDRLKRIKEYRLEYINTLK